MALRLTLDGQPSNMGKIQEFTVQADLDVWLLQHGSEGTGLLPNASLSGKTLTFDGGIGKVTTFNPES